MFRIASAMLLVVATVAGRAAAQPAVTTPDGAPVAWDQWVGEHSPVVVVLVASWAPGATETLEQIEAIRVAAESSDLELVVVSVQEGIDEARRALEDTGVEWKHDRYGSLLKHYRVVRIPAMLVVSADREVVARLEPSEKALRAWTKK